MFKKKKKQEEKMEKNDEEEYREDQYVSLKPKTIKQLIAPSGIDASNIDHLEIISEGTRYARSF